MTHSRLVTTLVLVSGLSTLGFVGIVPAASASCTVNVAGPCLGDCDVNVLATCDVGGTCQVNASAYCQGDCFVNVAASCVDGTCRVNAVLSTCSSSACTLFMDPFCVAWGCIVNAVLAECIEEGHCLINVASTCSGGCTANLASPNSSGSINHPTMGCGAMGTCTVNLASHCDGNCTVNVLLADCAQGANCEINALGRCQVVPILGSLP